MQIISWNVNGIRAVVRKGALHACVATYDPDVLCFQETRAHPEQVRLELPGHLYQYWYGADRRGYAGTAMVSKTAPLTVRHGMGVERHDHEGRVLTAEFAACFVVSVYVPNAKRDLSRLADRQDWDDCLLVYLKALEQHKPVVCGGDCNVAHTALDLTRPRANVGQHGCTREERAGFQRFIDAGFVDTLRHMHPTRRNSTPGGGNLAAPGNATSVAHRLHSALRRLAPAPPLGSDPVRGVWLGSLPCAS